MKPQTHFDHQRMSGIALAILFPWFIYTIINIGLNFGALRHYFSTPFSVSLLYLLSLSIIYHAYLGFEVVVEDYLHCKRARYLLLRVAQIKCVFWGGYLLFCCAQLLKFGN
jgi:succinate dehydrogenase / fumarate reductase membrane anchor subunit